MRSALQQNTIILVAVSIVVVAVVVLLRRNIYYRIFSLCTTDKEALVVDILKHRPSIFF
jgi:hypothetical protein